MEINFSHSAARVGLNLRVILPHKCGILAKYLKSLNATDTAIGAAVDSCWQATRFRLSVKGMF